jgi:type I restriction-modification system DNA methylase subunit
MSSVASDYSTDEKMFLKKYSGMGGLEKYGATGIGLFYEYFTPDEVVKKMWGLAYKHGYNNGRVLEPSCGIGSFLEYAPDKSNSVGYEINSYSAVIAKVLYPKTTIIKQPFETIFIKDNSSIKAKTAKLDKYDLVIGNPPYGEFKGREAGMGEKSYTTATNYIEYFLLRGLDLLNTDGLLIMIIGTEVAIGGTPFLQQGMTPAKKMIMERGDLLEAYRLPNGVFDTTDALTDIVVIKKK